MSETTPDPVEPEPEQPPYPDDLVAAVRSAQLSVCTQEVPAALALRLEAAAAAPAGSWRRSAGHDDPRVVELEAPYRRVSPTPDRPASEPAKRSGSRRRRSTTTRRK